MILDALADATSPGVPYSTWVGQAISFLALILSAVVAVYTVRWNKRQSKATSDQAEQAAAALQAEREARRKADAEESERRDKELKILSDQLEVQREEHERRKRRHADQMEVRHKKLPGRPTRGPWKCCICNKSNWPIREVRAGIRDESGKYIEAIGLFGPTLIENEDPDPNTEHSLKWLNKGHYCIFIFSVDKRDVHEPDIAVRFIDFDENEWQMSEGSPPKPLVKDDWHA